jgi:hypothetical protein
MRPITAVVSFGNTPAYVNLDSWSGAAMGVQVNVTGGGAFMVDYSFDDPNDLTAPIPLASMMWDRSMLPTSLQPPATGIFTPITFSLPAAPVWFRARHMNGVGQTRVTFLQLGVHSRSNISAPQDELLVTGPNFNRVHNGG